MCRSWRYMLLSLILLLPLPIKNQVLKKISKAQVVPRGRTRGQIVWWLFALDEKGEQDSVEVVLRWTWAHSLLGQNTLPFSSEKGGAMFWQRWERFCCGPCESPSSLYCPRQRHWPWLVSPLITIWRKMSAERLLLFASLSLLSWAVCGVCIARFGWVCQCFLS